MRIPNFIRALLVAPLCVLGACTPDNASPEFAVAPGGYQRAFEASESVLRDFRFALARIDARAGVISSQPKGTSGLATPWDVEQSTLTQEFEDLASNHSRRVRITFERLPGPAPDAGAPAPEDLSSVPLLGRVDVVLIRTYARNWRPSSASILDSTYASDPLLTQSGQSPVYEAPLTRDERLAARIAERIRVRLAREAASPVP